MKPTECYIKGAYGCFEEAVWPQATFEERLQQFTTTEATPNSSPTVRETPVAFTSPVPGSPAISPTGIPATAPANTAIDRLGRMLNDVAIVDATGTVIGMVHEGRPVHIVGADAGRLRIRMHDGQEGFVAADSVVDVGEWIGSLPERTGSP